MLAQKSGSVFAFVDDVNSAELNGVENFARKDELKSEGEVMIAISKGVRG